MWLVPSLNKIKNDKTMWNKHVSLYIHLIFKGPSLAVWLYLINEFIDDVPEPLVGQLQRSRSISICSEAKHAPYSVGRYNSFFLDQFIHGHNRTCHTIQQFLLSLTQNVIEEVTVIVVGLKSLVESWSTLQGQAGKNIRVVNHIRKNSTTKK